jgi:choline dehydrogenase
LDAGHVPGEPEHDWGYTARGNAATPEIQAPRGKALGGSSAVNATVAMRARAADIRDWQRHGVDWTVGEVHELFKMMENTPDGEDPYHGRSGPFPIRQERYADLTTSLQAFIDAGAALGYPRNDDFNGASQDGIGGYPVNVIDGVRQNVGLVYLTDEVRARPNLTIRGDVLIDRVLFDGTRAIGVLGDDGTILRGGGDRIAPRLGSMSSASAFSA